MGLNWVRAETCPCLVMSHMEGKLAKKKTRWNSLNDLFSKNWKEMEDGKDDDRKQKNRKGFFICKHRRATFKSHTRDELLRKEFWLYLNIGHFWGSVNTTNMADFHQVLAERESAISDRCLLPLSVWKSSVLFWILYMFNSTVRFGDFRHVRKIFLG